MAENSALLEKSCFFTRPPDKRWKRISFQDLNDENICESLWNDLVAGEILVNKQGVENTALDSDSSLDTLLWDWGNVPGEKQLLDYVSQLKNEQEDLCKVSALKSKSTSLMLKQLYVVAYHYWAVSAAYEKATIKSEKPSNKVDLKPMDNTNTEAIGEVTPSRHDLPGQLMRIGSRFTLSFAFLFLRKMWRMGEDSDLCTEILQDTLDAIRELPLASFYDCENLPIAWQEVVDRCNAFLRSAVKSVDAPSTGHCDIPEHDQHIALNLLLELALQRGTLSHLLDIVVFLINIWESRRQLPDNRKEGFGSSAPLGVFLGRIAKLESCDVITDITKKMNITFPVTNSVTPDAKKEDGNIDLRQAAVMIMSHVGKMSQRLFTAVGCSDLNEDATAKDQQADGKVQVFCSSSEFRGTLENLDYVKVKQICAGKKSVVVLTHSGDLHRFNYDNVSSKFHEQQPELISNECFVKVAMHPDGLHLLALTKEGNVYSYGNNEGGRLGHGDVTSCWSLKVISVFGLASGRFVSDIACGCNYSAAVTDKGELYTWGCGTYGRLGHGTSEDQLVPTRVTALQEHRIVAVSCGTADAHTMALTDKGKVFSWGDGDHGKLGLGHVMSKRSPQIIRSLEGSKVTKVHCGQEFSLAVASGGKLFAWGKASPLFSGPPHDYSSEDIDEPKLCPIEDVVDVESAGDKIVVVTGSGKLMQFNSVGDLLNPSGTHQLVKDLKEDEYKGLAVGHPMLFVLYQKLDIHPNIPQHLPYVIDTSAKTFQCLDTLFTKTCTSTDQLSQDKESLVISCIEILQVQLCVLSSSNTKIEQGPQRNKSLANIKARVVFLASRPGVPPSIQSAAQQCLLVGWKELLPTAEERSAVLSFLLSSSRTSLAGKSFMTNLLVRSLLAENSLEMFFKRSIEGHHVTEEGKEINEQESTSSKREDKQSKMDSIEFFSEEKVTLARLIEQLLTFVQENTLSEISQLSDTVQRSRKLTHNNPQSEAALKILQRFQTLMFAHAFATECNQNAVKLLTGYIRLMCNHTLAVTAPLLPLITPPQAPPNNAHLMKVINNGVLGSLLPAFVLSLTLLQSSGKLHKLLAGCNGASSMWEKLNKINNNLNSINSASSNLQHKIRSDLAWPETTSDDNESDEDADLKTCLEEPEAAGCCGFDDGPSFYHTQHLVALLISSHYKSIADIVPPSGDQEWVKSQLFSGGLQKSNLTAFTDADLPRFKSVFAQATTASELDGAGATGEGVGGARAGVGGVGAVEEEFLRRLADGCRDDGAPSSGVFLKKMRRFFSDRSLVLPPSFNQEHPVQKVGRLLLACLLKHHDLTNASICISQHPDLDLPPSITQLFRVVHSFRYKLIHLHQTSKRSYKEITSSMKQRLRFLLNELSPATPPPMRPAPSGRWRRALALLRRRGMTSQRRGDVTMDIGSVVAQVLDECLCKVDGNLGFEKSASACQTNWDLLFEVSSDPGKRRMLSERMSGRKSISQDLTTEIEDFALKEDCCGDELDAMRGDMAAWSQSAVDSYKANSAMMNILGGERTLAPMLHTLLYGWTHQLPKIEIPAHPGCHVPAPPPQSGGVPYCGTAGNLLLVEQRREITKFASTMLRRFLGENDTGLDRASLLRNARFLIFGFRILSANSQVLECSQVFEKFASRLRGLLFPPDLESSSAPAKPGCFPIVETQSKKKKKKNNSLQYGPELAAQMKVGVKVVRGRDWKWQDQDGFVEGVVIGEVEEDGWVRVRWSSGATNSYRMGKEDKYDLRLANPPVTSQDDERSGEEQKESGSEVAPGRSETRPLHALLWMAEAVLKINCLKISLSDDNIEPKCLSSLSRFLREKLEANLRPAHQKPSPPPFLEEWVTVGFVRSLTRSRKIREEFSDVRWINLCRNMIGVSADEVLSSSPEEQVMLLLLLRSVMRSWSGRRSEEEMSYFLQSILRLLASLVLRDDLLASKRDRVEEVRFLPGISLSCDHLSTVAEEIVHLIRILHQLPTWNDVINKQILSALGALANNTGASMTQETELRHVIATLYVITGVDPRFRIGGSVIHACKGIGKVNKICQNGSITAVYSTGQHTFPHTQLRTFLPTSLRFDPTLLPWKSPMLGRCGALMRLALCGPTGRDFPAKGGALEEERIRSLLLRALPILLQDKHVLRKVLMHHNNRTLVASRSFVTSRPLVTSRSLGDITMANNDSKLDCSEDKGKSLFDDVLLLAVQSSPLKAGYCDETIALTSDSVIQVLSAANVSTLMESMSDFLDPELGKSQSQIKEEPRRLDKNAPVNQPSPVNQPTSVNQRISVNQPISVNQSTFVDQVAPVNHRREHRRRRRLNRNARSAFPLLSSFGRSNEQLFRGGATRLSRSIARCLRDIDNGGELPHTSRSLGSIPVKFDELFPSEFEQLAEMGFQRRRIFKAFQAQDIAALSGASCDLESLITWLLDDCGADNSSSTSSDDDCLSSGSGSQSWISTSSGVPRFLPVPRSASFRLHLTSSSSSSESDSTTEGPSEDDGEDWIPASERPSTPEPGFRRRDHFGSEQEYAEYVRDHIKVGMIVCCREPYEEVSEGDYGQVVRLDSDHLNDLNVQATWINKGGSYWVRYSHVNLVGLGDGFDMDQLKGNPQPRRLLIGNKVRVKPSVESPHYKWGSVSHSSVGTVTHFSANGKDVVVDFEEQNHWTGLVQEMEVVPQPHEGVTCNSCQQTPLLGERYQCEVCPSFNMCWHCFTKSPHATPRHTFTLTLEPGDSPVHVGPSGSKFRSLSARGAPRGTAPRESTSTAWDNNGSVRSKSWSNIEVSSSQHTWFHLVDNDKSTYWEGAGGVPGSEQCDYVTITMRPHRALTSLTMQIDPSDPSHLPRLVSVLSGDSPNQLREERVVHIFSHQEDVEIMSGCGNLSRIFQIRILDTNDHSVPCRIRGLLVQSRALDSDSRITIKEEQLPFLVSDSEEETSSGASNSAHTPRSNQESSTKVFVWGLNDKDQLGGMKGSKLKVPVFSRGLSSLHASQISGGSKSMFALTADGKVYACGESTSGRLGLGPQTSGYVSKLTRITIQDPIRKIAVHSGGRHCLALTSDGKVYSWGDGDEGKLGHGSRADALSPRRIETFPEKVIVEIACGSAHSAAIGSTGTLYTWGHGVYGRLGHGNNHTLLKPKAVQALRDVRVVQVACGSRDAQTLCLTQDGQVYSWGDGDFGKLGRGGSDGCSIPQPVESLKDSDIVKIECGAQFSLALSRSGLVWTWGKGDYFRLGHGTDEHVRRPQVVETLKPFKVVDAAVGALHCLAVIDTGQVYAWGDNDHGQQGNGETTVNKTPALVRGLGKYRITRVACGSSHSIAFTEHEVGQRRKLQPVKFDKQSDSLGSSYMGNPPEPTPPEISDVTNKPAVLEIPEGKSPLPRTVLSTLTPNNAHISLKHVLRALQIRVARSLVCSALSSESDQKITIQEQWEDNEHRATQEEQGPPSSTSSGSTGAVGGTSFHPSSEEQPPHCSQLLPIKEENDPPQDPELPCQQALFSEPTDAIDSSANEEVLNQPTELPCDTEEPITESLGSKQPITANPDSNEPIIESFGSNQPMTTIPGITEPIIKSSGLNQPVTENPHLNEPITIIPGSNEPITIIPCSNEQITSNPGLKEPVKSSAGSKQPITASLSPPQPITSLQVSNDPISGGVSSNQPMRAQSSRSLLSTLASTSDHSISSLVAETITTTEEIAPPTPQKDSPASRGSRIFRDENQVSSLINESNAGLLFDLQKLSICGRMPSNCRSTQHIMRTLATSSTQLGRLILVRCVQELDLVVENAQKLASDLHPVSQESKHPYLDDVTIEGHVHIPEAESIYISFDPRCSTELRHDVLTITDASGSKVHAQLSGRSQHSDWSQVLFLPTNEIRWKFKSDETINGWGFKFTVSPVAPLSGHSAPSTSDRRLIRYPSFALVVQLFEVYREGCGTLWHDVDLLAKVLRSFVACLQFNNLGADHRIWIIRQLRWLMQHLPPVGGKEQDIVTKHKAASSALIKVLPKMLKIQLEYEEPLIRSNKQLIHSPFMIELSALCCQLSVDDVTSKKNMTSLASFEKYCLASRIADSLVRRENFPMKFLEMLNDRIDDLAGDDLDDNALSDVRAHEDHKIFTKQLDEQLVLWYNKRPDDWILSWPGSGTIFGWGHNHRGQLGGPDGAKIKIPVPCTSLAALRLVELTGGEQTLFAVTGDGKVFATGYGAGGRLGVGGNDSLAVPTLIESLQHAKIIKVSSNAGGKHALALSDQGEVYSWGEGVDGKLGHGNRSSIDRPKVIESLRGEHIVQIAAGGSHSAAVTSLGRLYTWGKGRYGRLGHKDCEDQLKPKLVEALLENTVLDVACGSGDAQTLCITGGPGVPNVVWSWGDGDYGKLGRGGSDGCKIPYVIDTLIDKEICKVACGSQFSLALSKSGKVYTWGKGDYFRLGQASDKHVRRPKLVDSLRGKRVVDVSVGSLHCICCTEDGDVYTWGDNDEGQVGDGTVTAAQVPRVVLALQGHIISRVACGSAHTVAWSSPSDAEQKSRSRKQRSGARLPPHIPLEYNSLKSIPIPVLRNRLMLLTMFSDLLCPVVAFFPLHCTSSSDDASCDVTLDELRGILVTSGKECVFRKSVQATMLRERQHGPTIELNRIQVKRHRTQNGAGLAGQDGLKSVFGQAFNKMDLLLPDHVLLPHRTWKVKFFGESVDDCGGGYSESIAEMCDELQDGSVPLLCVTPNGRDESGANRDCFVLNSNANSDKHMKMFKFLGLLIGIAIRTGSPLSLNLAEPVWKQLAGMKPCLKDISEVDKYFVPKSLYIKEMDAAELDSMQIPFSTLTACDKEVPLSSTHSIINVANRSEYIRLAIKYRLHEFDRQVASVREGISEVVPLPLLSLFTPSELETIVCGSPDVPLHLLKSVCSHKGISPNDELAKWFWEVLESFSNEERSLFLRFVWGRTRLPRSIADFRGRDFVIQVPDKYDPPDHYLPESYTCFFMLKLPRYSCKPVLEEKLKYAIHFCKSIDTDDYARIDLRHDDDDNDVIDSSVMSLSSRAAEIARRRRGYRFRGFTEASSQPISSDDSDLDDVGAVTSSNIGDAEREWTLLG